MILLRLGDRTISVISFSLLARLLRPDDYGLFALALSLAAIIGLVGQWGVDSAVIQRRGFDRRYYDTAWTLRILAGVIVAGAICVLAIPTARIFAEPRIESVLYWLALGVLVAGLENIGTVDFLKTLDYRRELVYRLLIRVVATTVAIVLAYLWRSYWALVAGQVIGTMATVVLSYGAHPYRPRLSLARFRGLAGFTRWVFVRNIVQGLNDQAANIIVGRAVGVTALAYFTFARELADIVVSDLYAPIRRALFPAYAAVSDDRAALKRLTLDSMALMMLGGLPLSVGIAVMASDAVPVLLGDRWLEVVPLLQILAISGCVGSHVSSAPTLFIALGRPDVAAKLAGLRLVVLVSLLVVGANAAGTVGAAWGTVVAAIVTGLVNWRLTGRALGLSSVDLWRAVKRPVVAAAIMAMAVLALLAALPAGLSFASSLLRLGAGVAIGAIIYAGALAIAWHRAGRPPGPEQQVLGLLTTVWQRSGPWRERIVRDKP